MDPVVVDLVLEFFYAKWYESMRALDRFFFFV